MIKITGKSDILEMSGISWRDYLRQASELLSSAGLETPMQEARYLTCMILNINQGQLLASSGESMTREQFDIMMVAIRRRAAHEPAAYIIGRHGFYGRDFAVGRGVLIPRPDTETLIEQIIKRSAALPKRLRILDTFTGSGCIGITLALELSRIGYEIELDLADISSDALVYARHNIQIYGLANICSISETDIWPETTNKYDLITANPPYIDSEIIDTLQPEVYANEPVIALDGGYDGLHFYRSIYQQAAGRLKPQGILACEHGFDQADDVCQIASKYGWKSINQYNDLGGNPRVTICNNI